MSLPVVFLPGIMGSRLRWLDGSGRVWDPDSNGEMLHWVRLGLTGGERLARAMHHLVPVAVMRHADGLKPTQVANGWGGVSATYYRALLAATEGAGRATFAAGYDWRQDLCRLAGDLLKQLQAPRFKEGLLLVTHSMGGLLARAAFAEHPPLREQVKGVIHVCQPCRGAVVLYRRAFTGCRRGTDATTFTDKLFCHILGTSGAQFVINLCGLPGALQLLPTVEYEYPKDARLAGWAGLRHQFVDDLYGNSTCPPGIRTPNASSYLDSNLSANLPLTAAFQNRIPKVFHENTWFLYGTGLDTDVGVFYAGGRIAELRLPAGDGTVPEGSAAPQGVLPSRTAAAVPLAQFDPNLHRYGHQVGLEHSQACNHKEVIEAVLAILGVLP
jgi:pimeloyl-ACP methyl ester carboxylesterase